MPHFSCSSRKLVGVQASRGFESPPLRSMKIYHAAALIFGLAATSTSFADEKIAGSKAADPQRIALWNGRAPVGDGQFEDADAWITLHRPGRPNGTAAVLRPAGRSGAV